MFFSLGLDFLDSVSNKRTNIEPFIIVVKEPFLLYFLAGFEVTYSRYEIYSSKTKPIGITFKMYK